MTALASGSTQGLLRHPPFALWLSGRFFSEFAAQMLLVAMGWQLYGLTGRALDLGILGLAEFTASALLTFAAGHTVDRYDRLRVSQIARLVQGAMALWLAWGSFGGWLTAFDLFAAAAVFGAAGAFESPAGAALLTAVAPEGMLQRATALSSAGFQTAVICGPALGGLAIAVHPSAPYLLAAAFWLLAAGVTAAIKLQRAASGREPPTLSALFAGVGFVRRNPAILGAISLDLFAVLLGGATALLPIYARDILHTGPWGLGLLRAAPAVGALLMTFYLTRHPFQRHVGMWMFRSVIVFGLATLVFGLSATLWLSLLALAVMGASDMISVVIRSSLVQLNTPDGMRGRVGAVNYLFINASNQLGGFESGATAALLGAVPAVVVGGVGTVAVALLWMWLFPVLRRLERLE